MPPKKAGARKAASKKAAAKKPAPRKGGARPGRKERSGKKKSRIPGRQGSPSTTQPHFPVAGIGAAAGGLEALTELFAHMPSDTGMAFEVITHQHPGHTRLLPDLLGTETGMPDSGRHDDRDQLR